MNDISSLEELEIKENELRFFPPSLLKLNRLMILSAQ